MYKSLQYFGVWTYYFFQRKHTKVPGWTSVLFVRVIRPRQEAGKPTTLIKFGHFYSVAWVLVSKFCTIIWAVFSRSCRTHFYCRQHMFLAKIEGKLCGQNQNGCLPILLSYIPANQQKGSQSLPSPIRIVFTKWLFDQIWRHIDLSYEMYSGKISRKIISSIR